MAKKNQPAENLNDAPEAAELSLEEKLAAMEAENEVLRNLTTEQSSKLAMHEKVNDRVVVSVDGKAGYVAATMRTADGVLTREQIAKDPALVKHLVKIGSGIIRFA